jgi:hypothetical protein
MEACLFDWPNISHRIAEWRPCIPVVLDVVFTNVNGTSVGVHQLEDRGVLALDGKTVICDSFTFAGPVAGLSGYVPIRVHG